MRVKKHATCDSAYAANKDIKDAIAKWPWFRVVPVWNREGQLVMYNPVPFGWRRHLTFFKDKADKYTHLW